MAIRSILATALVATLALPATAQAPAQPTAPAPAPAASDASASEMAEEPSLEERRIVAYVASGVAVASLAAGVTMGILAQTQFDCAKDIIACNGTLQNKVVGEELFDVRSEVEQKALFADMAYLFAGASAVVATVGFLRGFVFVDGEAADAPIASATPALPTMAIAPVLTTSTSTTVATVTP